MTAFLWAKDKLLSVTGTQKNRVKMNGLFIAGSIDASKGYVDWNGSRQCGCNVTPALFVKIVSSTDADCDGGTGTMTAQATGGSGNYTYSWSNGQSGATATGLTP